MGVWLTENPLISSAPRRDRTPERFEGAYGRERGGSGRRASKLFPVSVSLRSYRGREAETVTSWTGTLGVSPALASWGTEGAREEEGWNSLPVRRASNLHC